MYTHDWSWTAIPMKVALWLGFFIIWEVFWKGQALWKAAQNKNKIWFVALFLINSLGILPILYIYVFSEKNMSFKMKDKHPHREDKEEEVVEEL